MRELRFVVEARDAGQRVDLLVAQRLPNLSRRRAGLLCGEGAVTVDGRPLAKGATLSAGAEVAVRVPEFAVPRADPSVSLTLVIEREDLLVVDKPAGLPTAPLDSNQGHTLVGGLLARFPSLLGVGFGGLEPGLVHRLDNQTSGLLLVAREARTFARLRRAIVDEELEKRYLALVEDRRLAESGTLDDPIAPHPRSGRRVLVAPPGRPLPGARRATTRWQVLVRRGGLALVEVQAARAVRHQIRAHLAAAGHPLLGDAVYGGPPHPALGARHALHASRITWRGDATLPAFSALSPLPSELAELLER